MLLGRNPLVLVLAIGSGIAAFILALNFVDSGKPVPQAKANFVVTAVKDIQFGSLIRDGDVDLLPAPVNTDLKRMFSLKEEVVGKVSRRNILKGEAIKRLDILAEGDNLASLIPRGYRAMTIPVPLASNIQQLLQIGNRVDVILTYEASRGVIQSITLIENARVIGISKPKEAGRGSDEMDITLAVTPEGAQTLAYAMKRGKLNVAIRSLSEEEEERFFTLKELFFPKKDEKEAMEKQPPVPTDVIEIIRGVRKERYATNSN